MYLNEQILTKQPSKNEPNSWNIVKESNIINEHIVQCKEQ